MRVLLICGDEWHPGQVPIDGMKPLEEKGVKIDSITDMSDFNPKVLVNYDVVVLCKEDHISQTNHTSWQNETVQKAFVEYVEKGGGLLAVHSGICPGSTTNTDTLDKLVGCRFVSHPNNCPVTFAPIKPHPVMDGVSLFVETDEHYHIEILTDDIDILAASYAAAQGEESKYESEPYFNCPAHIAPSAYIRTQNKGRVCVLTPGHTLTVWMNPEFQRLLENALRWCAD